MRVNTQAPNPPTAALLGPHPDMSTLSVARYFAAHSRFLPQLLPEWNVKPLVPTDNYPLGGRRRALRWVDTYVAWPLRLRGVSAEIFHVVDQGLAWYLDFVRSGKRVITVHDLTAYLSLRKRLPLRKPPLRRRPLLKRSIEAIAKADHLIAVSKYTADTLMRELKIAARVISIIPNSLDPVFSAISDSERIHLRRNWLENENFAIVHVSQPAQYKNRLTLLRAFHLLQARIPKARLLLAHGEPDAAEAEFLKHSISATAISFLPRLENAKLRELYCIGDVFVFPSLLEGFGMPPLEAMACGCPVICTSSGGLAEAADNAALFLSSPIDYRALSERIELVLTNQQLAHQLKLRGLAHAAKFHPEIILSKTAEVYRSLL
jgi:glycosyltransferase involved in cell wall biosynthesis